MTTDLLHRVCACAQVRKASRALTQIYNRHLEPTGLLVTQYSLLANIARAGQASISELVAKLLLEQSTLTRNLAVLEKQGYLRSQPGADRRVKHFSLTEAGREALRQARPRWEDAQRQVGAELDTPEVERLFADLQRLIELAK